NLAVLSDVLCDRRRWKWRGALGLCAIDFDVVRTAARYRACVRDGRRRAWRDDSGGHRAKRGHSLWMEGFVPHVGRHRSVARASAELALHPGPRGEKNTNR